MLRKIKREVLRWFITLRYWNKRVKLDSGVHVSKGTRFEGNSRIFRDTQILNSFIGYGTYIAPNSTLWNCRIGRFCSIGQHVKVATGRHPTKTFVTTHPAFFSTQKQAGFTFTEKNLFEEKKYADSKEKVSVVIGNDVWIGQGVTIIEGVKIGDGAIIGTNALVTKDIEPYSINVGQPARVVDYRFNEKHREFLLQFKWWERDYEWLKQNYMLFQNIDDFFRVMYSKFDLYEQIKPEKREEYEIVWKTPPFT